MTESYPLPPVAPGIGAVLVSPTSCGGHNVGVPDAVHPLDSPVWEALHGAHSPFAESVPGGGRAVRYQPGVAPFAALDDVGDPAAWEELASLVGPGGQAVLVAAGAGGRPATWPPPDWTVAFDVTGVQMIAETLDALRDPEAVALGAGDVPEMLDLIERTRPGPFAARTVELGGYLGIRRGGRLVAMAGQRLRPGGHAEISAVCTDPDHRGRGLGARLVGAVAAGMAERDERPFLHAATSNTAAIRLYEALGMRVRCEVGFVGLKVATRGTA